MHLFTSAPLAPAKYRVIVDPTEGQAIRVDGESCGDIAWLECDCNLNGEPMIWPSLDAAIWHRKLALRATETDGFHL